MKNSDQVNTGTIYFYERYSNHTDSQILEILKNQKDYQENARNAAVKIAIERQLINSEQDLLSPEFQNIKNTRLTLFPQMTSGYHHQRLEGSSFRFLYVLSFLPIVYGFLKYAEGSIDQTILGVCVGLIWLLLVIMIKRTKKSFILLPLFGILIFVGASVGFKIASNHPIRILDFVIFIIVILLSAYFLILVNKLIQNNPENLNKD
jgi:predicted RND superfamily exporter protein